MNELARSIFQEILSDKKAWDYGTKKSPNHPPLLRYSWAVEKFRVKRQDLYFDRVWWPVYFRMVRSLRFLLPESCFVWYEDMEHWSIEDEELQLVMSEHFTNYLEWYDLEHPQWIDPAPAMSELLAAFPPPDQTFQLAMRLEA